MDPLILTLALDAGSSAFLQALREAHYPRGRHIVPAHVTLFHALPGAEIATIAARLAAECTATPPSGAMLGPSRSLGHGVALTVSAPAVAALRERLAEAWRDWLTPQDAQSWRPHATIQNKVSAETAHALHAELSATLPPRAGTAEGLLLWHYRGGPWEPAGSFPFRG